MLFHYFTEVLVLDRTGIKITGCYKQCEKHPLSSWLGQREGGSVGLSNRLWAWRLCHMIPDDWESKVLVYISPGKNDSTYRIMDITLKSCTVVQFQNQFITHIQSTQMYLFGKENFIHWCKMPAVPEEEMMGELHCQNAALTLKLIDERGAFWVQKRTKWKRDRQMVLWCLRKCRYDKDVCSLCRRRLGSFKADSCCQCSWHKFC